MASGMTWIYIDHFPTFQESILGLFLPFSTTELPLPQYIDFSQIYQEQADWEHF